MSLIGKQFPDISVKSINSDGDEMRVNLHKPNVPTVLFWYPKDFTFVCPTEIIAFAERAKEFNDRGFQVFGASCDTCEVHFAWLNTPQKDGGIEGVSFPIIADSTRALSKELDILDEEDNVTYRATYLIDAEGRCFHASVNDMPIGRNIDELLRLIDAKLHVDKFGEVCPAGWQKGDTAVNATRQGIADYLSK
tara:strand:- start:493 stop:1071 length:579 start_codon:yes stop_codon:yes gene_type:complete